jgi:hypothetical protein
MTLHVGHSHTALLVYKNLRQLMPLLLLLLLLKLQHLLFKFRLQLLQNLLKYKLYKKLLQ